MRADRLVATLLLMQARGRVTAAILADELEISVATARRDLEALSAAGIPVYPQPGRGGGWQLLGGARTDLSGLSASEARELFLLLGPAASLAPEARSALRKLVRALPETFRADAEAAAMAVVVDHSAWSEATRGKPAIVAELEAAVIRRRGVDFDYVNRAGNATRQSVDPLGLVDKNETWYLIAGTASGRRSYRIERISELTITDRVTDHPADFDVAAAWSEIVEVVESARSQTSATVLVDAGLVHVLRGQFGRHVSELGSDPDGRARVRVAAPAPLMIAQHLAGWGAGIEVVEPDSVKTELARISRELGGLYG